MKRTLSIILAIMMILSTVSFAAPQMAGVVDTAKETSDTDVEQVASNETAGLTAERVGDPVILKEWNFSNDLEGVVSRNSTDKNTTYEYESGVEEGNWWIRTNNTVEGKTADPYGEFLNLSFAAENVTSIEVKVKKNSDIGDTFALYYVCNNGAYSANVTQTYSGTEWQTIVIDPANFNTTWNGTFTKFRLDPGNKAETTYYIDYVRIYGYHNFTPGINVMTGTEETFGFENLGNATFTSKDGIGVLSDENGKKIIKCTETTMEIADTPVAGETGKALKITGHEDTTVTNVDWAYDSLNINGIGYSALDDNRPVFVTFKSLLADADYAAAGSSQLWVMKDNPSSMISLSASGGSPMFNRGATMTWKKNYVRDEVVKSGVPFSYIQFRTKAKANYTENWGPITYIDDIGYYPYYKVTYMNGSEVFDTAYVLDDGNGNILKSFDPAAQGVAFPEGKNAWSLTENGEKAASIALEGKDIKVFAVYEKNFKPGINMLTGTEDTFDFNDGHGTETSYFRADGSKLLTRINAYIKFSNADSPVSGDTGNKALLLTPVYYMDNGNCYPDFYPNVDLPEDGRPVFVSFKSVVTEGDEITNSVGMNVGSDKKRGSDLINKSLKPYLSADTVDAWTKYYVKDNKSTVGHAAFSPQFGTTAKATTDDAGKKTPAIANATVIPKIYIDDLMYVPYYEVTYMNGSEKIDSVYVLDDGNGNILESFDPEAQGIEFPEGKNGWSLKADGKKVTSVALENKDIVLYAVAVAPDCTDELLYAYEFNSQSEASYFTSNAGSTVQLAIEDGNAVFNFDVMKTDGTWNDSRLNTTSSSIPNMKLSDMKRIAIRFRPSKLDSYVQDGVVKEYSWTNSFENVINSKGRVQICASAGGWKYPVDAYFGNYTADADGYYTIDVDVSAKTTGIDIIPTNFIVLMHQNLKAPVKFEIDYLRIYGNKGAEFSPSLNAPQKVAEKSLGLRVDSAETTGVRFKSSIANSVRAKAALAEYGWIVALADVLGKNELTHQFKLDNGKTAYVTGKNYCKAENLDKIYETGADYTVFTAVVTGVPVEYADKYLVVRPYSVIGGAYVYGESIITSPREVGQKLYDKWVAEGSPAGDTNYDYVKYQEYIDALGIKK